MHNITIRKDGMAEVFTAGEKAWHNLGQNVDQTQTWSEAIKLAGLNWQVKKENLFDSRGNSLETFGIFRDDNNAFLGNVGSAYTPIQNVQMGETLDYILQTDQKAYYETAGSLDGGKQVWAMIRIPEKIKVGDDITEPFLLFSNRHDGKGSAIVKLITTRVVCNNTLTVALRENSDFFKISHYPNVQDKLNIAKEAMRGLKGEVKNLGKLFNRLNKHTLTMQEIGQIIKNVYPKIMESNVQQNKARSVLNLYECNDNNVFKKQKGTAYSLLNAFTAFSDHNMYNVDENEKRMKSALFGAGEALKFMALQEICNVCQIENNFI